MASNANGGRNVGSGSGVSLRSLTSALVERFSFARRHGLSFAGRRDLYSALGYADKLTTDLYRSRFRRGGIAGRVVEVYPKATWSGGADIVEDPDTDTATRFEQEVESLFERLSLWSKFLRADILAGLGERGYSILLIGATGDLSTELPRLSGPDSIPYITPYAQDRAEIGRLVGDKMGGTSDEIYSPRFGLPDHYKVKLSNSLSVPVHWTRCIHVCEDPLEDDVYGKPSLETVWNNLDDLDKLVGGGSEAAWQRMQPPTLFDLDPEMEIDEAEQEALTEEIDKLLHGMQRYAQTRGVTPRSLSQTVAAFGSNAETVLTLIAGTKRIPKRILLGSERGELSSSQDRENFNDATADRRRSFAEPVVRQLLDRLIQYGGLSTPTRPYVVLWPEEEELSEIEKAEAVVKFSTANKNQAEAQGRVVLTGDEIRDRVLGMEPLEMEEDDLEDDDLDDDMDEPDDDTGGEDDEDLRTDPDLRVNAADSDSTDDPDFQAVHRAADRHTHTLGQVLLSAWEEAQRSISATDLESRLANRDIGGADRLLTTALRSADERLADTLPDQIHACLSAGARGTLKVARDRGSWFRGAEDKRVEGGMLAPGSVMSTDPKPGLFNRSHESAASPPSLEISSVSSVLSSTDSVSRSRGSWFRSAAESAVSSLEAPRVGSLVDRYSPAVSTPRDDSGESFRLTPHQALMPGQMLPAQEPVGSPRLQPLTGSSVQQTGDASQVRDLTLAVSASFDSANPRAVSWAASRSSTLVTEIGLETLAALRALIAQGIAEGISPRRLTQYVRRSVGLRSDQVQAVQNLAVRLLSAKPGTLVKAGKTRIRIPRTGVSQALIDKRTGEYAKRLLNQRALLIGQSESLRASNQGVKELWLQAQDQGLLPPTQKRKWITAGDERVRPRHADMSGQVVGVNESFSPVSEPGSEVRCRCVSGLVK